MYTRCYYIRSTQEKIMKILITGACGYQGTRLVTKLLKKNIKVVAIDTQWFGNYLAKRYVRLNPELTVFVSVLLDTVTEKKS